MRDFSTLGLGVVIVAIVALAGFACLRMRLAVLAYMTLARAHAWLELAVLALLAGRAPSGGTRSSAKAEVAKAPWRGFGAHALAAPCALLLPACGPGTSASVEQQSDTTQGTYRYTREDSPAPRAVTMTGELSNAANDAGYRGAAVQANGPSSVVVALNFVDTALSVSQSVAVDLTLNGISGAGSAPLGAGSQACFEQETPFCFPLTGTLTTTAFTVSDPASN